MVLAHQIFHLSEINHKTALKNNQQVNSPACVASQKGTRGLSGSVRQPGLSVPSEPSTGPLVVRAGGILEQSLGDVDTTMQIGIGGR